MADRGTTSRRGRSRAPGALLVALLLAGCTGEAPGGEPEASSAPTTTPPAATPSAVALPSSSVGEAAGWVLEQLAADAGPSPEAARERFSPGFLDQLGATPLSEVLDGLRALGPWTPTAVEGTETEAVVSLATGSGTAYRMQVVVDAEGVIGGLLFTEDAVAGREPATSWGAVTDELAGLADEAHLLAARVEDGTCVPVDPAAELAAGEPAPLGSVFKLYVLGAVAAAVEDGELGWDDELEVTADVRSLPSGELQDAPEGAVVSVREAAGGMIAISDNTAADLLATAVGRPAVEEAVTALGTEDEGGLVPFLTTREYFTLGWGAPEVLEQWPGADAEERRDLLQQLPPTPEGVAPADVVTPVWPQGAGWAASAQDVCRAHVRLQELAARPGLEPVREVLAENPGVPLDEEVWDYAAFKGGSAPGVLAASWYLERADGEQLVLVAQAADGAAVDQPVFFALVQDALALLAESP
ncbi:Cpe/LpqF family protein [uncultured Pseudokineococcus sp.]|uniref:Cpe/LpqF family protein n=1 Tax=uncultured Pseudokineococcus sp. TaxID=1642928 RepID=UPI002635DEF4|nr:Cpe/LpqF family protein [uncultured Pseudokineococcus sp.]